MVLNALFLFSFAKNYLTICLSQKKSPPLHRSNGNVSRCGLGRMAEWSNAAVLKTVDLHGSGGSNPSSSAKKIENVEKGTVPFSTFPHFHFQQPCGWIAGS